MNQVLDRYRSVAGDEAVRELEQLGRHLAGARVIHVNSTRQGGGVAEILDWMIPLMCDLGIAADWQVVSGDGDFFAVTKAMHNGLQGQNVEMDSPRIRTYMDTNRQEAERLRPILADADFVFIHDPQPAALLTILGAGHAHWIWRCHIDISAPQRRVWRVLRPLVEKFEASIYSLPRYALPLPHPQFVIAPSIDPLSEKNRDLTDAEMLELLAPYGLDPGRPLLVQISRFDAFKDPIGVIQAYRMVKKHIPVQLVLAGGGAADDPEGDRVLNAVRTEAATDPDIHVLALAPDSHRTINALQRAADIVIQKSVREGFGLTVTEGLWKGKPVIGGNAGGIRLQVFDHHTGFLVNTPEGAAQKALFLLTHRDEMTAIGQRGHRFVRENFLLTRQLREYLILMAGLRLGFSDRLELDGAAEASA
jgi:trehalose synthase